MTCSTTQDPHRDQRTRADVTVDPTLTVLVTGFEPFDSKYEVNPSFEIVRSLPDALVSSSGHPHPIRIIRHPTPLPVDYDKVKLLIPELLSENVTVDMVLHIGMATQRSYYTIEQNAHRDGYDRYKDNRGRTLAPEQGVIDFGDCLETMNSSFAFEDLLEAWQTAVTESTNVNSDSNINKIELRPSDDAGHFLCDYTYYNSLAWFARQRGALSDTSTRSRPVMFLHVPPESDDVSLERGRVVTRGLLKVMAQCIGAYDP